MNYTKNKLDQLKGFCAMVECGNINDAAKANYTSPTTISKQISSLEEDLGFPLFNKIKNKLIINKQGKIYYKEAKKLLLELDKLYGGKLGVRKISGIERFFLQIRKQLDVYQELLVKFIKKMIVKVKIFHIAILFTSVVIGLYIAYSNIITSNFNDKLSYLTRNIADNILQIEKKLEMSLDNASLALEMYVDKNPNVNMIQLKEFCHKLHVDNCGIQNADGIVILSSRKDVNDPKNQLLYQSFKISDQIKEFDKMKSYNSKVYHSSFYGTGGGSSEQSDKKHKIVKGIDRWSKKLNKILYMKIRDNQITDFIKQYRMTNRDNILYIDFITPSGNVIATTEEKNYNNKYNKINNYIKNILVYKKDNLLNCMLSFGGMQDETWTHKSEKDRGLTNDHNEYFYTINIAFDNSELGNKIFIARIVIVVLISLISILYFFFRKSKK